MVNINLLYILKKKQVRILNACNKEMINVQVIDMLITLIWKLHVVYLYQTIILYPINMHNYYMSTKNKKKP